MQISLLHFADAHIDAVVRGRIDPDTLLPIRVTDFLRSLDTIVETAIQRKVDLVLFAGDAYRDRNPHPTYQREWGKRIIKLSQAGIPCILLVGNHDMSPAQGRATTLTEYKTLNVPHVHIVDEISLLGPKQLGIQAQVMALPWLPYNRLMAHQEHREAAPEDILEKMEDLIISIVDDQMADADPNVPTIFTAHASVTGAQYSSEQLVTLGSELIIPQRLIRNEQFDYVALGHIHRHQSLNAEEHPPAVYAGSIERVDFSETKEDKGFVLAKVGKGNTTWEFVELDTRPFASLKIKLESAETAMDEIINAIEDESISDGSMVRIELTYPQDWEARIDDSAIYTLLENALVVRLVKNRVTGDRVRTGDIESFEDKSPAELLEFYLGTEQLAVADVSRLIALGSEIISAVDMGES